MGRERPYRAVSAAPASVRHKLTSRNKPSYKVVLEQVTQQKKKLIVVVCFNLYFCIYTRSLIGTSCNRGLHSQSLRLATPSYLQEILKSLAAASNLQELMEPRCLRCLYVIPGSCK